MSKTLQPSLNQIAQNSQQTLQNNQNSQTNQQNNQSNKRNNNWNRNNNRNNWNNNNNGDNGRQNNNNNNNHRNNNWRKMGKIITKTVIKPSRPNNIAINATSLDTPSPIVGFDLSIDNLLFCPINSTQPATTCLRGYNSLQHIWFHESTQ